MSHARRHSAGGWARLLSRPVALLAWSAAILLLGIGAAVSLPLEWVPTIALPKVTIHASWPGAPPQAVERSVTAPIERAVQGVAGIIRITSSSETGQSFIELEVSRARKLAYVVADLGERLARLRAELPDHVVPELHREVPEALRAQAGFMTLQLVGPLTPAALRHLAEHDLAPALRSVEGVAAVRVYGGREQELLIALDPDRLDALGIDTSQVRQRLFEALADDGYGRLRDDDRTILLMRQAVHRIEALGSLVVAAAGPDREVTARLRDVAELRLQPSPLRSLSRVDGEPVVTLVIDRAPHAHLLRVADRVDRVRRSARSELPPEVELLVADDRSEQVREQLTDLAKRGGAGLLLVIAVLRLMLRSSRAVGVVLFSVAVALSLALSLLEPFGLTLNVLTLGGLVLVFGLVVDNAVVVMERLETERCRLRRKFRDSLSRDTEATRRTLETVWLPLLAANLSTLVVLGALIYLSGELRQMFASFGVLVALVLVGSLATAALVIPVLGRFVVPRVPPRRRTGALLVWPYHLAARYPRTTLAGLVVLIGLPVWLLPLRWPMPEHGIAGVRGRWATIYNATWGRDAIVHLRPGLDAALGGLMRPFFRDVSLGNRFDLEQLEELRVRIGLIGNSEIGILDELVRRFERRSLASPAVARTVVTLREDSALLRVLLTPEALLSSAPTRLENALIDSALPLAGVEVSIRGPQGVTYSSGTSGPGSALLVRAEGPSYETLQGLAEQFAARLMEDSRVIDIDIDVDRFGFANPSRGLRLGWGSEAVMRSEIGSRQLIDLLAPRLTAHQPSLYARVEGIERVPVRLVEGEGEPVELETLLARSVRGADGGLHRLEGLANLTLQGQEVTIERVDQRYRRYIRVRYRGPSEVGGELLDREIQSFDAPMGYRLERDDFRFFTPQTTHALLWLLLGTVCAVYVVIAAVFEDWRLPLAVMLGVPTAAVGVACAFLATGADFAEGAFLGLVLLVGIAVNDNILLVDRYRCLRHARPDTAAARLAMVALRDRLRPMWTTTLTTVASMLPLVVMAKGGFWAALAITVIGGLLASTVLGPAAAVAFLARRRPGRHAV